MELSDNQKEILFNAYALAAAGRGQVVADDCVPECHALAEAGWLERRVEPDGELSWWWTRSAEMALDVNALVASADDRQN